MTFVHHRAPGEVLPDHLAEFIQPPRGNMGLNSHLVIVEINTANGLQRASYPNTVCRSRSKALLLPHLRKLVLVSSGIPFETLVIPAKAGIRSVVAFKWLKG
jgi:hypothetical protein